jgi:hypothetical protein
MTKKEILLWIVLLDFAVLTAYTIYRAGYIGGLEFGAEIVALHPWGLQLILDFVIALSLALVWMFFDARSRGIAFWPFALLTFTLGSIGPLAYLIRRERVSAPQQAGLQAAPQRA